MSRCIKCGGRLQGLDHLQGFEYSFCAECVATVYRQSYDDDFLDDTLDPDEEIEDDDE